MTVYAYCRVSTPKQKIERQIKNIKKEFPEINPKDYYLEEWTGTTTDRPQWKRLERKLKSGDTVIFDSVSRMSRQAAEGFDLYKRLYEKGVDLQFLKEPFINTSCYKDAMVVSVPNVEDYCLKPLIEGLKQTILLLQEKQFKAAFEQAEKEIKDLRQRTKEGFTEESRRKMSEHSKANKGRKLVTKKSLDVKPKIKQLSKDFDGVFLDKDVIKFLRISVNTYYKYKKELKEELENEKYSSVHKG